MTNDESEYVRRAQRMLFDIFAPRSTPNMDAEELRYVGMDTTDGPAFPCPAQSDAEAVTQLMGAKTYDA